ncbi:MAG: 3-oxoacyl-[acyl-carrier-protein] reductase [Alphaproteobacteria bacterium]|nr:MAG: 3-oxoacyl-[acyl-carrier-protein] reductase [Alphaproteobacteria bacterium]
MMNLSGKTALITGATGGIGGAIAKKLHAAGATVMLTGTRVEVLQKLAGELGDRAHVFPVNLSDGAAIDGLITEAETKLGKIDILIANAGVTRDTLLMRMKDEDWQQVIDINLTGTFRLVRAALRGMMKNRYGRIISVGSVVGTTGNPGQANYCASKAGLIGFSKALAQEVASRNITVNVIAPGFIETPMTDVLTPEQKEKILTRIPMGKMGTANDIADTALFLSSDAAGYITGQTLHVNGGMAMI